MEDNSSIIENAQEALIEASKGILESIEHAPAPNHHEEAFYLTAEFWVAIAFILVVILLFKPITNILGSMLTKRIETVVNNINEANKLKEDAQLLLAEYETKFQNADNEAKEILTKSKK